MFADIAVFSVQTPARKQKSTRPFIYKLVLAS